MASTSNLAGIRRSTIAVACVLAAGVSPVAFGGVQVAGYCYNIGGLIASTTELMQAKTEVNSRIKEAQTSINNQIVQAAEKIVGTLHDQTTAQTQMIDGLTRKEAEIAARQSAFDARAQIQSTYGSPPGTVCSDANAAAGTSAGNSAKSASDSSRKQSIDQWMRDPKAKVSQKIVSGAALTPDELSAEDLLLAPEVSSADQAQKNELVNRMIDFAPPQPLSPQQVKTPNGQVYQARLNERRMRLEPAAGILRHQAADTDPAYPLGQWSTDLMSQTGFDQTAQGKALLQSIHENGDKVSAALRLELQAMARSPDSEQYQQQLQQLKGADLQRELIEQLALSNKINYERLRLQQRVAVMQASNTADRVNQTNKAALDELRTRSVTFSNGNGQ